MISLLRWISNKLINFIEVLDGIPNIFTINTYQVRLVNELREYKLRALQAERSLASLKEVNNRIVARAVQLNEGEMTPFVLETVIEIENGMRTT